MKEFDIEFNVLGNKIITDKEEAIKHVESNGYNLYDVSKALQNDKEVVMAALGADMERDEAFSYASPQLRQDKAFMLEVLYQNPTSFEYFEDIFRDNMKLARIAVKLETSNLQYVSERLRSNKELVYIALCEDEEAINYASQEIIDLVGTDEPRENMQNIIRTENFNNKLDKKLEKKLETKHRKIKI